MTKKVPTSKQCLGRTGESKAAEYLIKKGYSLVTKNYRYRRFELDLLMKKDSLLVIVEVKSLVSPSLGEPEYRVNKTKQKNIINATWAFLSKHKEFQGFDVRFDIIIVDFLNYPVRIKHYKGAFIEEVRMF